MLHGFVTAFNLFRQSALTKHRQKIHFEKNNLKAIIKHFKCVIGFTLLSNRLNISGYMSNIKTTSHLFYTGLIIIGCLLLSGCAALQTSIAKRNLNVQTIVSSAIFVDAVKKNKRTVYVEIRSSVIEFDRRKFKKEVIKSFIDNENGYTTTDDPDSAQYHLSISVLNLEKTTPEIAAAILKKKFIEHSQKQAIIAGALIGEKSGHSTETAILFAVANTIANAYVSDVTYMLVADVQIKERTRKGVFVRQDSKINNKVSDSGNSTQRISETTNQKVYRTRIVTTANKSNLELSEAEDLMFKKTAYAMSGFF